MDFKKINKAQLLLKMAALLEKKAGGETTKGVLEAAKHILHRGAVSALDISKAGLSGVQATAKSLETAGHPILGVGARVTPWVAGGAATKSGLDKYQQWKLERAYRRQMGG